MSTRLVWGLLSVPAAYLLAAYCFAELGYGAFIHHSGQWSIAFLLLALAVSPLRRFTPS